ncbi:hypothetical protein PM082_022911 [Marasmius tenuissimus]|nr:hypothetical protein PM082_022911 [Marasmius tenuissimus]
MTMMGSGNDPRERLIEARSHTSSGKLGLRGWRSSCPVCFLDVSWPRDRLESGLGRMVVWNGLSGKALVCVEGFCARTILRYPITYCRALSRSRPESPPLLHGFKLPIFLKLPEQSASPPSLRTTPLWRRTLTEGQLVGLPDVAYTVSTMNYVKVCSIWLVEASKRD